MAAAIPLRGNTQVAGGENRLDRRGLPALADGYALRSLARVSRCGAQINRQSNGTATRIRVAARLGWPNLDRVARGSAIRVFRCRHDRARGQGESPEKLRMAAGQDRMGTAGQSDVLAALETPLRPVANPAAWLVHALLV